MDKKDIVSFLYGSFDENHSKVLAVTPSVNGVRLPDLVTKFEEAKNYEPVGGYGESFRDGSTTGRLKNISWANTVKTATGQSWGPHTF
jgi:hypothetical protein